MPPTPAGIFAGVPSHTSSAMVPTVAPTTSFPRRDEKYKAYDDSWKKPVIVVSTVVGSILVAVIIVLAVLLARTRKKKKSLLNALSQNMINNNHHGEPRVIEMDDMTDREDPRPETPDNSGMPPPIHVGYLPAGPGGRREELVYVPVTPLSMQEQYRVRRMPMSSLSVPPQHRSSGPVTSPPSDFFQQDEEDAAEVQTEHRAQAEEPPRGIPRSHMMARLPRIDTTQLTNLSPIRAMRRMLPATPNRRNDRDQEQDELVIPSTSVTEAGPSGLPAASSTGTVAEREFDEVDHNDEGQDNGETQDQNSSREVEEPVIYSRPASLFSRITPFTAFNSHRVYTGQEAVDKQAEDMAKQLKEQEKREKKEQSDKKGKKVDRGLGIFERLPALPSTPSVMAMTPAPLNIVKRHSYKDSNVAGVEKKNIVRRAFTMIADRSPIAGLLQTRSEFGTQSNMDPIPDPVLAGVQEDSSADNAGEGPSRQAEVEVQAETSSQPVRPSTPTQASTTTTELDETPDYSMVARQRLSGRDPVSPRPRGGIFEGPEFEYLHKAIALRDSEQPGDDNIGFPFDNDNTTSTIFGGNDNGNGNYIDNEESSVDTNAATTQDDAPEDENSVENEDTAAENAGSDNDTDSEPDYTGFRPVTDMIQPVRHAVSSSSANANRAPAIPARSPARPQSYVQQRYGGRPQSGVQQQGMSPQFRRVSAPIIVRGGSGIAVPPAAATRGLGYNHASIASSTRTSMTVTPATVRPALTPADTATGLSPSSSMGSTGSILTESPSVDSWLENLVPVTTMGAAGAIPGPASGSPAFPSSSSGPTPVRPDHPVTNRDGTVVHDFAFRMPPALPTVGDGLGDALLSEAVLPDLMPQPRPSTPSSEPDIAPSSSTPTSSPPASASTFLPRENLADATAGPVTGTTTTGNNSNNNEDKKEVKEGDVRSKVREFETKAQRSVSGSSNKTKEKESKKNDNENEDEQKEQEESKKRQSKPVEKPEGNWI